MAILLHADLGNRRAVAFVAGAECRHAGHVGLECEDDDVVHGAEILAEPLQRDIAIQPRLVGGIDFGARRVEPFVRAPGPNLDLAHRCQILFQPAAILLAELIAERPGFTENRIENAASSLQAPTLFGDPTLWFREHIPKHDAGIPLRRQPDAIGGVRERVSLVAHFDRRVARERRGHLGHELIDRDGVPFRLPDLATGQPNAAAVVVMPQAMRMMQAADRRDVRAVLLERLQ